MFYIEKKHSTLPIKIVPEGQISIQHIIIQTACVTWVCLDENYADILTGTTKVKVVRNKMEGVLVLKRCVYHLKKLFNLVWDHNTLG